MGKRSVSYEEELYKILQDPAKAEAYLNASLNDEDPRIFLLALKDVIEARFKISDVAKEANLNRENIYRILSKKGNPKLTSIQSILNAVGLNLAVQSKFN
jgi:probable addiction module antidote protein